MASLEIGDDVLRVRLRPLEHALGFSRDVVLPLTSIVKVSVLDTAEGRFTALRGWRSSGVALPGSLTVGTRRHGSGWDFTAIRKNQDGVLLELNGGRFEQVLVTVPDATDTARRVAEAAGIALS